MPSKPRVTQDVPKTATNPTQSPNFVAVNPKNAHLAAVEAAAVFNASKRLGLS